MILFMVFDTFQWPIRITPSCIQFGWNRTGTEVSKLPNWNRNIPATSLATE
ncbi:hypothetical protein RP20_CCG012455 [Aedes albopictus]|nr:hypothetical protein RP20_CCG012455 [Aedes albopictus]